MEAGIGAGVNLSDGLTLTSEAGGGIVSREVFFDEIGWAEVANKAAIMLMHTTLIRANQGNRLLKFTVSNYFTTAFRCQYLLGQSGHVDTSAILDAGWVALGASGLNKTPD